MRKKMFLFLSLANLSMAAFAQGNAGLNPPHGQPNHRCDIAVGAPLNSAPAKATAPVTYSKPGQTFPGMLQNPGKAVTNNAPVVQPGTAATVQQTTAATPVNAKKTAAGMNPAHGQPNHRCDIPVGAPLNSKPAKAGNTVQTAAPVNTVPATNAAGQKLNPPHGQPGHDCTIEVGKPLKQG